MTRTRFVAFAIAYGLQVIWAGCGSDSGSTEGLGASGAGGASGASGTGGSVDHDAAAGAAGDAAPEATPDSGSDSAVESGPGTDSGSDASPSSDAGGDADTGPKSCQPAIDSTKTAMVFDIDATLTTADSEYTKQMADPAYDPAMRPDANTLAQGYAALGYKVFYVTARGTSLGLLDGTSATDATTGWLDKHAFPRLAGTVFLAPGFGATGTSATTYKTGVLQDLQSQGYTLFYAYGNATTDIDAYQNVAVPNEHIFLVGSESTKASTYGVNPITDADAYTNHLASYLPSVPCAN